MKWTEDGTYKFVGLYRDYECLWNMSSANYKNKHICQRAIEAIMQAMGREEFGVTEVSKKLKTFDLLVIKKDRRYRKAKHQALPPTMCTSRLRCGLMSWIRL
jgi:hypothetical protein